MDNLLKILVQAELDSKSTGKITDQLDDIAESYKGMKVDAELGEVKGFDALLKNIEALSSKMDNLGKNAGVNMSSSLKDSKKEMDSLGKSVDNLLRKVEKIDKKGKTTKETTGDKFKTTTITRDGNGSEIAKETVENYKELNKVYDEFMKKASSWKGVDEEDLNRFKEMADRFKDVQVVSGKKAGESLEFGSKAFLKQLDRLQSEYDKLVERESAYQLALKESEKLRKRLNTMRSSEKNLLDEKDFKVAEQKIDGGSKQKPMTELKTTKAVQDRANAVNTELDNLATKNQQEFDYRAMERSIADGKKSQINEETKANNDILNARAKQKQDELNAEAKRQQDIINQQKEYEDRKEREQSKSLEKSAEELKKSREKQYKDEEDLMVKQETERDKMWEKVRKDKIKNEEKEAKFDNKAYDAQAKAVQDRLNAEAKARKEHEDYKVKYAERQQKKESDLLEEQAKEVKKRQKEEQDLITKNANKLAEEMPFIDQRIKDVEKNKFLGNVENGDQHLLAIKRAFDGLDLSAKNFNVQLKIAKNNLKSLEKEVSDYQRTSYADANSKPQKEMNVQIKRERHLENAGNMLKRGVVSKEQIQEFKDLANLLDWQSTKLDLEEIQKEWRKLLEVERDAVKSQRESKNATKEQEKAYDSMISKLNTLESQLNDYNTKASKLGDAGRTAEVRSQIDELIEDLKEWKRTEESLSTAQHEAFKKRKSEINALIDLHKMLEAQQLRDEKQEEREDRRERRKGDTIEPPPDFNFRVIEDNDIRGNQQRIREEVMRTLGDMHEGYFKLDESMVRVKRTINEVGEEIYTVNYTLDRGGRNFEDYTLTIDRTNQQIRDLGQNMRQLRPEMTAFERLSDALMKVPIWATATGVIYGAMEQVRLGFETILEVDNAFTDLRKVAGESTEQLRDFRMEAVQMGQELGMTADQVIQATTDFARLGYSLQEAKLLGEQSLIYANVGDMQVPQANEAIISAVKGFGVQVDKEGRSVARIVDIFNEVGNNFAISSAGIGEALQRSSAMLHQAGNSIEESVALVTAANTTIQDPKQVGTALKTITMRLRGMDDEGKHVAQLVPELQRAFADVGVELLKTDGSFKNTYEIMNEFSGVWENMTDQQRAYITELIGGKRQGAIVASMIQNWSDAIGSYEVALNSAGSAQEEFSKYQDSMQYKLGELKGAWQEMWMTIANEESVKMLIESLTEMIRSITELTRTFGVFAPIGLGFITFLTLANSGLRGFVMRGEQIKGVVDIFGKLKDMQGMSLPDIGKSAGGWVKNIGMIALRFAGVAGAVTLASWAIEKWRTAQAEAIQAERDRIATLKEEQEATEQLIQSMDGFNYERYNELMSKRNPTIDEKKELNQIQQELVGIMPNVIDYYDKEGNAVYKSAEELKNYIALKKEEQQTKAIEIAEGEIKGFDTSKLEKSLEKRQEIWNEAQELQIHDTGASFVQDWFNSAKGDIENGSQEMEDAIDDMLSALESKLGSEGNHAFLMKWGQTFLNPLRNPNLSTDEVGVIINQFVSEVESMKGKVTTKLTELDGTISREGDKLAGSFKTLAQKVAQDMNIGENTNQFLFLERLADSYADGLRAVEASGDDVIKYLGNFAKEAKSVMKEIDKEGIDLQLLNSGDDGSDVQLAKLRDLANEYGMATERGQIYASIVNMLSQEHAQFSETANQTAGQLDLVTRTTEQLDSAYNNAISSVQWLNGVSQQLNETGKISGATMNELISKYPSLLQHIGNEGALKAELINVTNQEKEAARMALAEKMMMQESFWQQSMSGYESYFNGLGEGYRADLANAKTLAEAKLLIEQRLIKTLGEAWSRYYEISADGFARVKSSTVGALLQFGGAGQEELHRLSAQASAYNRAASAAKNAFAGIAMSGINLDVDFDTIGTKYRAPKKTSTPKTKTPKAKKEETVPDPDYDDPIDAWIRQNQIKSQNIEKNEELINQQIEMAEKQEDYNKQIQLTNNLVGNHEAQIKELGATNDRIHAKANWVRGLADYKKYTTTKWFDVNGDATVDYTNFYNSKSKEEQEVISQLFTRLQKLKKQFYENRDSANELKNGLEELKLTIEDLKFEKAEHELDSFIDKIDSINNQLDNVVSTVDRGLSLVDPEDELSNIKLLMRKGDVLQKQRDLYVQNIQQLKEQQRALKIYPELLRKNQEEVERWEESLKDLATAYKDNNDAIKDIYENLAEEVVDIYKEMIEKQQELAEKAVDEEMKLEDERHNNKMKNLDEEMSKFEESIRKQLELMDEQKNNDNYEKGLLEKQKKRQEIKNKINEYSMDETFEGIAKKQELEEELADIEEDLAEYIADREYELRKKSLEDQLKEKQKTVEKEKKEEDDLFNHNKQILDKKLEELQKFYDNQLADEERWNKIRQDIFSENIGSMVEELEGFTQEVTNNSQIIGENLSKSLINKLQEAKNLLQDLGMDDYTPDFPTDNGKEEVGAEMGDLNEADFQLLGAKYYIDKLMPYATTKGQQDALRALGHKMGNEARASGATLDPEKNKGYDDLYKDLNERERILLAKYIREKMMPTISTPALINIMRQYSGGMAGDARDSLGDDSLWSTSMFEEALQKYILGFDTGGYTGDQEGIAMLHKKELILNKLDTKNILDAVKLTRDMFTAKISAPRMQDQQIKEIRNEQKIEVNFNIDKLVGGEEGAQDLMKRFTSGLKRKGVKI